MADTPPLPHKPIPMYTKVGIRVTTVIIIVLLFFILKNCAFSIYYGSHTSEEDTQRIYKQGFQAGEMQAKSGSHPSQNFDSDNLLLKKMYQKGFREGWDSYKSNKTSVKVE